MTAVPAPSMIDLTSAKSTLINPGVVMRSVIPPTPCNSTSSAILKASIIDTPESDNSRSRWLGITMSVSTSSRNA